MIGHCLYGRCTQSSTAAPPNPGEQTCGAAPPNPGEQTCRHKTSQSWRADMQTYDGAHSDNVSHIILASRHAGIR
ncbi:unnamed protein product [Rodentolepis nana]|uniref:Uncharacterized protein n=1 Tax=Rodentolepis nana TaxID=102285 RepID=A0A0R3TXK2_RODNA|nr:unnamed protein product [Rodentolepis nana]